MSRLVISPGPMTDLYNTNQALSPGARGGVAGEGLSRMGLIIVWHLSLICITIHNTNNTNEKGARPW